LGIAFTNCLDLAQFDRLHDRQYIALHKNGKGDFAMHAKYSPKQPKRQHLPLICFNFLATPRE